MVGQNKRIVVESPRNSWHRVAKIAVYGKDDGGFAVIFSPHTKAYGLLEKFRANPVRPGSNWHQHSPLHRVFQVSKVAKLSFHGDGRVQFSGNGVTSGWHENGKPKGLALQISRFDEYASPKFQEYQLMPDIGHVAFTMTIWGLEEFDQFDFLKNTDKSVRFSQNEISGLDYPIYGDFDSEPLSKTVVRNGYIMQGVFLPKSLLKHAYRKQPDIRVVARRYRNGVFERIEFRIIELNHPAIMLGIFVMPTKKTRYMANSGFDCGSIVGTDGFSLLAIYPKPEFADVGQSLDFRPSQRLEGEPTSK